MVFVSIPLTLLCLLGAFILMLGSFEAERITVAYLTDPETGLPSTGLVATVLGFVPSVSYTILVLVLNLYYLKFSHYLTEWENHRTQEQFEKHAVSKLILFEFVNTFLATFYIGFYLQDVAMLKSTVSTMLVVSQIVNQLQETLVPIFLRRPSTRRMFRKISKKFKDFDKEPLPLLQCEHSSIERLPQLTPVDFQVVMANYNLKRDPYESTYDDFMELWLQFGHVFLFSSVYPLAGCLALVNNLFEIKVMPLNLIGKVFCTNIY
jgi:anoctamin-10